MYDYNEYDEYGKPKQKPYAIYIHGMGSGAKSGTKTSFGRYFPEYEWLSPEVTHDPFESLQILDEWITAFQPQLIAGTSMGGFYTMYAHAHAAIKLMLNPVINIETVIRKIGYGKHPYHCEREDGATEFVIDEPLIQKFTVFKQERQFVLGSKNIALFSSDDELVGKENSKKNAAVLQEVGVEVHWSDKFGHRSNDKAIKKIKEVADLVLGKQQ